SDRLDLARGLRGDRIRARRSEPAQFRGRRGSRRCARRRGDLMDASLCALMAISGPGIFFDGVTSARRTVTVELGANSLRVLTPGGDDLAEWPFGELAAYAAPEGVLRLGRAPGALPARLEIHDREPAAALPARLAPPQQLR